MIRVLALAVVLFAPALGSAQGVTRSRAPDQILPSPWRNIALSASAQLQALKVPSDRSLTFVTLSIGLTVASGGGAGDTVFRACIPSGTANSCAGGSHFCDFTLPCATSGVAGVYNVAAAGECTFPGGSLIVLRVESTNCTTSQPNPSVVNFHYRM